MHFPVEGTRRTLVLFTVLTSCTIGFGKSSGDKTLDLRIGFDLTQGTNGDPALRIRDFEDLVSSEHERRPRAEANDKDLEKVSPSIRADSFSDEHDKYRNDETSNEKKEEPDAISSDESDGDAQSHRSTKGLSPGEYEPEENAKVHGRYKEDDDSGVEDRRRRKKREIDYAIIKRKGKKFRSARKQGITGA